ncbi:hypothetical protein HHI36_020202, partial [Cryptolaemus montrouzieri]
SVYISQTNITRETRQDFNFRLIYRPVLRRIPVEMMMADAMIQIHAQHKASKLYDVGHASKPRTSLPKITSNPAIMGDRQRGGVKRGNSFIVGQKLRESKWFRQDEMKIVCAVVESGFILEKHENGLENTYGVIMWVPGY